MLCGSLDGKRGGFGGEWIHVYVWLSCPSEIITTLLIDYKIARRNINNLKYADNTTLMVESKEELKSLLMKVRGE